MLLNSSGLFFVISCCLVFVVNQKRCDFLDVRRTDLSTEDLNIHTQQGLKKAVMDLARVKKDQPVLIQPTCSSWGWVSRGVSLRGLVA